MDIRSLRSIPSSPSQRANAAKTEPPLSAGHRAELFVLRAEAQAMLDTAKRK